MNPDHSTRTINNEDEIQSSTNELKQDDFISIGTDNVKNLNHIRRFQCGQLDQATCASSSTGEVSQQLDSLLLMKFQDFIGVSSNNWQREDDHSFHFTFSDSITFLHDEDCKESGKGETDEYEDEDSICDSIVVTVRRRLKQSTVSSSDNEYFKMNRSVPDY